MGVILIAIVLDIQTAHYFSETIKECKFGDSGKQCYCSTTKTDYDYLFDGMGDIDCNNIATRNTGILQTNVAFSGMCFIIVAVMIVSFLTGCLSVIHPNISPPRYETPPPSVRHIRTVQPSYQED